MGQFIYAEVSHLSASPIAKLINDHVARIEEYVDAVFVGD